MKLLRGDAHLAAESELSAVGETGGGVDVDGGAVHPGDEYLRRSGEEEEPGEKKLTFDKLVINLDSYELLIDGHRVDTPPKELELLYHLAASPNRVFTRNQLLDEVWGFDYFGDSRTVDVHVKRLRGMRARLGDSCVLCD